MNYAEFELTVADVRRIAAFTTVAGFPTLAARGFDSLESRMSSIRLAKFPQETVPRAFKKIIKIAIFDI